MIVRQAKYKLYGNEKTQTAHNHDKEKTSQLEDILITIFLQKDAMIEFY